MRENPSQQDIDLLFRIQQGEHAALTLLVSSHYADLFHYGTRFTTDEALIKDCLQEVFISLWQRRQSATSILSPKFYLLRAIKNKVLKSLYTAYRKNLLQGIPDEYDFHHEFAVDEIMLVQQSNQERMARLHTLLNALSKREREIIYLKYYQYLDHEQIADIMNIGRQSVYNLLHTAINKLRDSWQKKIIHQ